MGDGTMGVNLTLTADHGFGRLALPTVARAFEPLIPCFESIARRLAPDFPHLNLPLKPWVQHPTFPPGFDRGQLILVAPAGFTMWFGPHAVFMRHVVSFDDFTGDRQWQHLLCHFARECMRALGADRVLFCPSEVKGDEARDGVVDGLGLVAILRNFAKRFGPAAISIEDMLAHCSSRHYVEYLARVETARA